mgnify:FL=1
MKINEQYHNLNLLENVTYKFLGRDGEVHEETEPILVEHMMDVYVNERLTMKLVGEDNVRETTLFPRDLSRLEP